MAQADYILVQLPSNDSTRGLIGHDALGRIKPGAVLIDVARPEWIDHEALVGALQSGRLGGLGLDVLYSEPADPAEPLLRYRDRNVILMPHTAVAARANALCDVETLCVNLWRAIAKERGQGLVRQSANRLAPEDAFKRFNPFHPTPMPEVRSSADRDAPGRPSLL